MPAPSAIIHRYDRAKASVRSMNARLPKNVGGALAAARLLGSLLLVIAPFGSVRASGIDASGSFTDGQQLTIRGSGFGEKPNAKPLYFWDFGNGRTDSSSLGRLTYKDVIRGTLSKGVVAAGSKTALQVETGGTGKPAGPENGVYFDSDSLYVWIKHRYEFE